MKNLSRKCKVLTDLQFYNSKLALKGTNVGRKVFGSDFAFFRKVLLESLLFLKNSGC